MAKGKGKIPEGAKTQPLPPVRAPTILGAHKCGAQPTNVHIRQSTDGWEVWTPKEPAAKQIKFCPYCGGQLPEEAL